MSSSSVFKDKPIVHKSYTSSVQRILTLVSSYNNISRILVTRRISKEIKPHCFRFLMENFFDPGRPVDFTKSIDRSLVKDQTALVTGGASGIGLAIVKALVEAGAIVTIADINKDGTTIAESIHAKGHQVQFVKTDVTS